MNVITLLHGVTPLDCDFAFPSPRMFSRQEVKEAEAYLLGATGNEWRCIVNSDGFVSFSCADPFDLLNSHILSGYEPPEHIE